MIPPLILTSIKLLPLEMTDFTVNLVPYGQSYTWDRELFLSYFPESLIASALLLDPTSTEVNIELPVVTPIAMNYLDIFLNQSGDITQLPSDPEALTEAGRYLGIDLYDVLADPNFAEFNQVFYPLILVKPHRLIGLYNQLIEFAILRQYYTLLRYIFSRVPPNDLEIDKINLMRSVAQRNAELVTLFLPRVSDPMRVITLPPTEAEPEEEEEEPSSNELAEKYGLSVLSVNDATITSMDQGHLLYFAVLIANDSNIVRILLADPRISDYQGRALEQAARQRTLDLFTLLLQSRRYSRDDLARVITELNFEVSSFGGPERVRPYFDALFAHDPSLYAPSQ